MKEQYLSDNFIEHFHPCRSSNKVCQNFDVVTVSCPHTANCGLKKHFDAILDFILVSEDKGE